VFSKRGTELRLTALLLLAGAVIAWLVTVNRMRGMDMGPGTDLGGLGWFAGVWAVMMAAMMLPSLVPMAGTYAGQARGGSDAGARRAFMQTTLFVGGYLVTWVLIGLAAWALVTAVRALDVSFLAWHDGGRYVAGAVIAAAGLYELTPLKASCLRRCRDRGLLIADWRGGPLGAARLGLAQGAYCIGSSWALMAALFALGVMSITWMVVIAALIAMEKLLPHYALASRAAAALLLALAAGVALVPEHLPGLTIPL
jgi:predicted metal-binding membrane protein